MPLPANTSGFEAALRQATTGILPSSPEFGADSAFNGVIEPPITTPITQPDPLLNGWGLSWDLGGLQGLQPSHPRLENGTVSIGDFRSISVVYR